jgi:hypothetical protein
MKKSIAKTKRYKAVFARFFDILKVLPFLFSKLSILIMHEIKVCYSVCSQNRSCILPDIYAGRLSYFQSLLCKSIDMMFSEALVHFLNTENDFPFF